MNGRAFISAFLLAMLAFILLVVAFNFYPPAGNHWLTVVGVAVYAAIAIVIVRKVGRK